MFETPILLEAIKQIQPVSTFLLDRYFPTNPRRDIFRTKRIIVEYKKGTRTVAPFISPRSNGVALERHGEYIREYVVPTIGIRRTLTLDNLETRGFGEALDSPLTPEQRQHDFFLEDLSDSQNSVKRKKEAMAAEVLFTNRLVVQEYGEDGKAAGEEWDVRFYEGNVNPAIYTPVADWSTSKESGEQIEADLEAMIQMLSQRQLPATDLIVGRDVFRILSRNKYFMELWDNRRLNIGGYEIESLPNGVTKIPGLDILGHKLDVYCYEAQYEDVEKDENGNEVIVTKSYVPKGTILLTAPNCGHTVHGAISQMEDDRQFHTYSGEYVPRYFADVRANTKELAVRSAPLMLPHQESPWVVAQVLTSDEEEPTQPVTPPADDDKKGGEDDGNE